MEYKQNVELFNYQCQHKAIQYQKYLPEHAAAALARNAPETNIYTIFVCNMPSTCLQYKTTTQTYSIS